MRGPALKIVTLNLVDDLLFSLFGLINNLVYSRFAWLDIRSIPDEIASSWIVQKAPFLVTSIPAVIPPVTHPVDVDVGEAVW